MVVGPYNIISCIIYTTIRDDYRKKLTDSLKELSLREDIESHKYNKNANTNNNSNNNGNNNANRKVSVGISKLTFNN